MIDLYLNAPFYVCLIAHSSILTLYLRREHEDSQRGSSAPSKSITRFVYSHNLRSLTETIAQTVTRASKKKAKRGSTLKKRERVKNFMAIGNVLQVADEEDNWELIVFKAFGAGSSVQKMRESVGGKSDGSSARKRRKGAREASDGSPL